MRNQPIRPFIYKIATVLMSVTILFFVAEVFFKIFGPSYYQFNNSSRAYYTNPRGYHVPIDKDGPHVLYGLHYQYSDERYRLPDSMTAKKSDKKELILGLGDSFTWGNGVKYQDLYLTLLESMLNKDGYEIGVKNCGRQGEGIDEIIETYRHESLQKAYPLVTYGFVLNDFGVPGKPIVGDDFIDLNNGGNVSSELRKRSSFYNFICHAIDKIRLHNATANAYLEAFRGEEAEKKFERLKQFHRSVRANKGELVIMLFPLLYDFQHYPFHEIHQKIAFFCEKEKIPFLDLLPAFSKYKAEDLEANPIDHHPNEIANRVAAEELYAFLIKNKLVPQ